MSEHTHEFCDPCTDVITARITEILMREIPGATSVMRATVEQDKKGTDFWVWRKCRRPLSVDVKVRKIDYTKFQPPDYADDLALETFNVIEQSVPGWTRDENKQTDYILWFWKDTGRWALVPFVLLCIVFRRKWEEWKLQYAPYVQRTPWNGADFHSECVFVPRKVVWREIYNQFAGSPPK